MADITLSKSDLKDIISSAVAAAVSEAKKPAPPTAAEQAEADAKQQSRKEQAELTLATLEEKRNKQKFCSHKHRDGIGHGVYVLDGNYILCQRCYVKVRPGSAPRGYKGADVYDDMLFTRMWQELPSNGEIAD